MVETKTEIKSADLQTEKYRIIQQIVETQDLQTIIKIKEFLASKTEDFWDELTEEQKEGIQLSKEQFDKGEKFSYQEVTAKYRSA